MKICRENPYLVTKGQKYWALCLKNSLSFIVYGEIKSP